MKSFKERTLEYLLLEEQGNQQANHQGNQIVMFLKITTDKLVKENPKVSPEEILEVAEQKLGKVPDDKKEEVLNLIKKLKEMPPATKNPQLAKKPGFFKKMMNGLFNVVSPILGAVGGVASLVSLFPNPATQMIARSISGFTMPLSMGIGATRQIAAVSQLAKQKKQQQGH